LPSVQGVQTGSGADQTHVYNAPVSEEGTFLGLMNVLLKRWRPATGVPLSAAFAMAIYSLLASPTYSATVAFVPETKSPTSLPTGLAGLAGQFGLSLGTEAAYSPRFYAQVALSRGLLQQVLLGQYPLPGASLGTQTPSAMLLDILGVKGEDEAQRLADGVRMLRAAVSAEVDNQTNIVRLSVDARDPVLAAAVANRFVQNLNKFNLETRQSQGRERRKFIEARLVEAERDLATAEETAKSFLERNRQFLSSPSLQFEYQRLERQVQVRQEVYLTLKREYETARIEEVNDTPVITVVDAAAPPRYRSKPKRKLLVLVGLILGGVAGGAWAIGTEYLEKLRRENSKEYVEFAGLLRRLRSDVRQMFRRRHGG
jgi:uncharacterized protein involved in exopolysaccharide biosynthesis